MFPYPLLLASFHTAEANKKPGDIFASVTRTEMLEMQKALKIYGEVLRLVRRLPKDTRPYYAKFARENFVNYRDVDANDSKALDELFQRAYNHSLWVLNKYSVDQSAADKLKNVCYN